jgi:hypothetical protein
MLDDLGLKGKLREVAALTGLLRSALIELSDMPYGAPRRGSLLAHIQWIADRLDVVSGGLTDKPSANHAPPAPADARRDGHPAVHATMETPKPVSPDGRRPPEA